MDEQRDEKGVVLSKGINFKDLLSSGTEFQVDIDFKDKKDKSDPYLDDDLFQDYSSDEGQTEEVLKNIEQSVEANLLSSPEYVSFDELAKKMTDCLPSGDVKILIIEEGDGQLIPTDAQVTIHYAAYWEKENIPFDSTLTMNFGAPAKYRLGTGTLLPGLDIGLTMVKGPSARFHLLLQPSVAWGERGVPPRIRPAPALFTVALLSYKDVGAIHSFNDLPSEEQKKFEVTMKTVNASNTHAKDLFKKKLYSKAVRYYHNSLTVLQISCPKTDEEREEIKKLLSSVYINLAVCYYKLQKPNKILLMCDDLGRIININKHCKGLYYYGKAFDMLGDYAQAMKYYKKALKLEPKNLDIGKAMADLDAKIQKSEKEVKDMWRTAFNNKAADEIESDVDEDFKNSLKQTCEDLASNNEFAKFDLPNGMTNKETTFIKKLVKKFEKLDVFEQTLGDKKKISLVRKL